MKKEHIITEQVALAQKDSRCADDLVRQYMPFIRSETAKFTSSASSEHDDYLSIAMFAFHEAVMAYSRSKGAFLSFASIVIKNKLIDYKRRESRHAAVLSLDAVSSDEDNRSILERTDSGEDNVEAHHNSREAKREILEFAQVLKNYDLELSDVSDNCPKQIRTLKACINVLEYAKKNPELIKVLEATGKLPLSQLSAGSGTDRKLLERHRKYLVAIFLAYTNGFEIIRDHLRQLSPGKGGDV